MTFLAPWALVVGAFGAAGVVLLHLVASQRPAAYLLPTARFIPDRRTLVSRTSRRPRDLLLLVVRVLLILSAATAFARPVLSPSRVPRARILLLDRSAAVSDDADVVARARTALADGVPTRIVAFDTATLILGEGAPALDSLDRLAAARTHAVGSITAALAAARRVGGAGDTPADSIELLLVSPVTDAELDAATDAVRALWPGAIEIARVAPRADTASVWPLERALAPDDVLWPAVADLSIARTARAVRVVRAAPSSDDSTFARAGGAVVRWDPLGAGHASPAAVARGDDVVVASLGRGALDASGRVLARWADGSPAAVESALGAGCIRTVAVGVPIAGDLPLRPAFQRIVRSLMSPCVGAIPVSGAAADPAAVARLAGSGRVATGAALSSGVERPTPIVSWLLGVALLCALLELGLRARPRAEAA